MVAEVKAIHEILEDVLKKSGSKDKPVEEHKLEYDSMSETLEPLYFFILDLVQGYGYEVEKIIDNFTSTPGSGHFSELGMKLTKMQEEGMKLVGSINTVLRSILNMLYDLKEFRTRLKMYDDYINEKNKEKKYAALLSLKQLWLDKVDIQKGNTSLKAMAFGQSGFQTLLDAFLIADDLNAINKLDLNERVLQILRPRISEFFAWVGASETELRKRYNIERNYLKSQLGSLKLYARWARPYLKAAADLEQKSFSREPTLVKAFNTIRLELTLLAKQKIDLNKFIDSKEIPKHFNKIKNFRDYYSCILLDFVFVGIPQRAGQQGQYAFGGKTEVTLRAYAVHKEQLQLFEQALDSSDLADTLKIAGNITEDSLLEIQKDVESFLQEDISSDEKKFASAQGENPFFALLGFYEKKSKTPEKTEEEKNKRLDEKKVSRESWFEKEYLRKIAENNAKASAFNFFDIYKKAHQMFSYT